MSRQNIPFLSIGNRGLISPKSLARVDLDRTRLSAEVFNNFIGKTQGALTIRPGTKYFGSSLNDTGAEYLEFVASTDDVALLELTHTKMRVWLGDDAHDLSLLGRPAVNTTVTLSDTGWSNTSTGGAFATATTDVIPTMTAATTNGVTITASSQHISAGLQAWKAADDNNATEWRDTGAGEPSSLPTWWNVDFGTDTGNRKAVASYSIRIGSDAASLDNAPLSWRLITGNFDTGTFATDTGKWTLQDERTSESGWAVSEKRTYETDEGDTGTVSPRRHWRLHFTALNGDTELLIAEIEMFQTAAANQVRSDGGARVFNATSIGALARAEKRVMISDTGTEHSLAIDVSRGPITLRVGSSQRDDDYVSETALGTGYHNLAFTPTTNFWITLQNDKLVDRTVRSLTIGDSGTVEITTPWEANDLANVRYDQSADVVYADCDGVRMQKIERRGTGRSWSVVDYAPDNGPFLPTASSSAKMSVSHFFGNTTLNSDIPFFKSGHVGALIRVFHQGQGGQWRLGALDAVSDPIEVTGITDTGTPNTNSERRIIFAVSGTFSGAVTVERSINGEDIGFKEVPRDFFTATADTGAKDGTDTGTVTFTVDDKDDNLKVWYRTRISSYASGVATVTATYGGGGITGVARITDYSSNTAVGIEVLERFSDTGPSDNWQQGYWSDARGFPDAVALHGGRLAHAEGGNLFLTVSDDFENFDDTTTGDAGPIIRSLGSGPVDSINFLVSLVRLIIGTTGAELMLKSSSLDEPVTPDNSAAVGFSTQGSTTLRAVKMDTRAIMVQRSGQRVFMIGPSQGNVVTDYEAFDLTLLVPDLLAAGVRSVAVQRQPDTRIHVVLGDGTVGILTYEPQEEVICWSTWSGDTGTSPTVEKVAVLPGTNEDAVFYHIRRTINGTTKRYLEKWAKESECTGDSGLCWLMDCAVRFSDTGRATTFNAAALHLAGESVVAWGDLDTGSTPYVDLSPDVNGVQTRWSLDTGGDLVLTGLTNGVHQGVLGLPFKADWRSSKLAYAAEMGTALTMTKRAPKMGVVIHQTHNNGLFVGGSDTGALDPLPRVYQGATVDADYIYQADDLIPFPLPSKWATDPRIFVRAKSPRPATILALTPAIQTSEN